MAPRVSVAQRALGHTRDLVVGALVLVAALAWRDALRGTMDAYLPREKHGVAGVYITAVALTVMVVGLKLTLGTAS